MAGRSASPARPAGRRACHRLAAGARQAKDPDGRATMGISSSGAAAFTLAWFHPELYHRVLACSPTIVNQQWPHNPALPGGARIGCGDGKCPARRAAPPRGARRR